MEIEKKFLIKEEAINLEDYPYVTIEQGYISTKPVIRIRKKDQQYILTYKSSGFMIREEFEEDITKEQYDHLKKKLDYNLIEKRRYLVPLHGGLTAEVDVFGSHLNGLIMAEVEFSSEELANGFDPPSWFDQEVTLDPTFHNSYLCQLDHVHFLDNH